MAEPSRTEIRAAEPATAQISTGSTGRGECQDHQTPIANMHNASKASAPTFEEQQSRGGVHRTAQDPAFVAKMRRVQLMQYAKIQAAQAAASRLTSDDTPPFAAMASSPSKAAPRVCAEQPIPATSIKSERDDNRQDSFSPAPRLSTSPTERRVEDHEDADTPGTSQATELSPDLQSTRCDGPVSTPGSSPLQWEHVESGDKITNTEFSEFSRDIPSFTTADLRTSIDIFAPIVAGTNPSNARFLRRVLALDASPAPHGSSARHSGNDIETQPLHPLGEDDDEVEHQDLRELSEQKLAALRVIIARYQQLHAEKKISFEDKIQFRIIFSDCVRDHNRRKLNKVEVNKEETKLLRTTADIHLDEQRVIEEVNDYRQINTKAEVGIRRRTKKALSRAVDESILSEEVQNRKSERFLGKWMPPPDHVLESKSGVVRRKYVPNQTVLNSWIEQEDGNESNDDSDDHSDQDSDDLGDITRDNLREAFIGQTSGCAIERMAAHALEPGPHAKQQELDDLELINLSTVYFQTTNKPRKRRGEEGYYVPRMKTTLLPHQVPAAAWMRCIETSGEEPRGGFFADDTGMGKTMVILAVFTDAKPRSKIGRQKNKTTLIVCPSSLAQQWQREAIDHCVEKWLGPDGMQPLIYRDCKLPKRSKERRRFLESQHMIIATPEEVKSCYPFADYPEHLVTDQEKKDWWKKHFKRNAGDLLQMHFHRFVIDECQLCVKSPQSQAYEAIRALKATCRWLMSGTPITDNLSELYPYFKIVHSLYVGSKETFEQNYLDRHNKDHHQRLQYKLRKFMFRREKTDLFLNMPMIPLHDATETICTIKPSPASMMLYRALVKYNNDINKRSKDEVANMARTARMMGKLQQLNSHPFLIADEISRLPKQALANFAFAYKEVWRDHNHTAKLRTLRTELGLSQNAKLGRAFKLYPIFEPYEDTINKEAKGPRPDIACDWCSSSKAVRQVYPCDHYVCGGCDANLRRMLLADHAICGAEDCDVKPRESRPMPEEDDFLNCESHPRATEARASANGSKRSANGKAKSKVMEESKIAEACLKIEGPLFPSDKLEYIQAFVLDWMHKEPDVKIIIFTQYKKMIRLLETLCQTERWTSYRLTGEESRADRDKNVQDFTEDAGPCIMLATSQTGGTGLNLTAASKVISVEPWWNHSRDVQAFARVHRIGQKKKTEFVRLIIPGTVDVGRIDKSDEKTAHVAQVLEARNAVDIDLDNYLSVHKMAKTRKEARDGAFWLEDDTKIPDYILERAKDVSSSSDGHDSDSDSSSEEMFVNPRRPSKKARTNGHGR